MHPILTIFCPFTREWALQHWLDNLSSVWHDPALTNLCFIIDGDMPSIARRLKNYAEQNGYRSFHVKINEYWATNESRLDLRKLRIAEIHNQSKDLIAETDGEIIIGLEDDTVFDRLESFEQLYRPLNKLDGVGFVEGVEMGRHGAKMLGAWRCDDPFNPKMVQTCLPAEGWNGLSEIDAGGFYGYATYRELYLEHEYYWSTNQPWGPDVNYGFWLRQRGWKCYVDWGILFGHKDFSEIGYPDDPQHRLAEIIYNKRTDNGKWERTDNEQDRY